MREDAFSELCCCVLSYRASHLSDDKSADLSQYSDSFCCSRVALLVLGQTRGQNWDEMLLALAAK